MEIHPSRIHLRDSSCHKLLLSCTADAVVARYRTSNATAECEYVAATEVDSYLSEEAWERPALAVPAKTAKIPRRILFV